MSTWISANSLSPRHGQKENSRIRWLQRQASLNLWEGQTLQPPPLKMQGITTKVTLSPWRRMPFSPWRSLIPMPLPVRCIGKYPVGVKVFLRLRRSDFLSLFAFFLNAPRCTCVCNQKWPIQVHFSLQLSVLLSVSHVIYKPLMCVACMPCWLHWNTLKQLNFSLHSFKTLWSVLLQSCAFYNQPFVLRHVQWPSQCWNWLKWVMSVNNVLQSTYYSHFYLLFSYPWNRRQMGSFLWRVVLSDSPKSRDNHLRVKVLYRSGLRRQIDWCSCWLWGVIEVDDLHSPVFFAAAKTIHTFKSSFCGTHSQYNMRKPSDIACRACERCRGNEVGCFLLNCWLLLDDVNLSMLRLTTASSLVYMEDDEVLWKQQPIGTEKYNINHVLWWLRAIVQSNQY
jgi:hypothetical protein